MKKLLAIVLLLWATQLSAQDGPTAGSALRSLSGVDMISGKIINVIFRESKDYTLFHFWKSESDEVSLLVLPDMRRRVHGAHSAHTSYV